MMKQSEEIRKRRRPVSAKQAIINVATVALHVRVMLCARLTLFLGLWRFVPATRWRECWLVVSRLLKRAAWHYLLCSLWLKRRAVQQRWLSRRQLRVKKREKKAHCKQSTANRYGAESHHMTVITYGVFPLWVLNPSSVLYPYYTFHVITAESSH